MIDYLQPPLGYLLRLPCGDHAADSPLDEPARDRAEQAAAFLRFERIGQIFHAQSLAAYQTAEIVWHSCSWDFTDSFARGDAETFCAWLLNPDRGRPGVLVSTQREIETALIALRAADVCGEIVAPGGVISLHRVEDKIVPRARHMIIDFSFTDLEKTVAWDKESLAIEAKS